MRKQKFNKTLPIGDFDQYIAQNSPVIGFLILHHSHRYPAQHINHNFITIIEINYKCRAHIRA